ncbi:CHAT domain-containing protein [Flammeovirga pectinis]|uniref:CHAT domain-containing protein n=1 Tax=Flammeovirga pectinis TaxID=2494373 RepID=A0A3Q9FT31_9BACT|nr:caspase family protein [Flammeovirga pectinis]AZQ64001.1 CHAT domain-containing protein [Flammeovirga pectinis]
MLLLGIDLTSTAQINEDYRLRYLPRNLISKQKLLTYHENKQIVAIAYSNNTIKLFDIGQSKHIGIIDHGTSIDNFAFDQQAEKLIVLKGKSIYIYDVYSKKLDKVIKTKTNLEVIKSNPNLEHVYINGKQGKIIVLNAKNGTIKMITPVDLHSVQDFCINSKGDQLAVLSVFSKNILLINPLSGKIIKKIPRRNEKAFPNSITFSKDDTQLVYADQKALHTFHLTTKKAQTITFNDNNALSNFQLIDNKVIGVSWLGIIEVFDLATRKRIYKGTNGETKNFSFKKELSQLDQVFLLSDHVFLINDANKNVNSIYDTRKNKIIGYLYSDANENLLIATTDGRFNSDKEFTSKLFWAIDYDLSSENITLGSTIDQMYTPDLLYDLSGKATFSLSDIEKYSPSITINSTDSVIVSTEDKYRLSYSLSPRNNEKIAYIEVFVNGKIMNNNQRGLTLKTTSHQQDVPLIVGENNIEAIAVSERGFKSRPANITVVYEGATKETNLYLLVVGVNTYKNANYNLNFAVADATSFSQAIVSSSSKIFKNTYHKTILNTEATRSNIINAFDEIKSKATPNDLFIFYFAGHGAIINSSDFHLILTDVTQIYGNENITSKALTAKELQKKCAEIQAQKQLVILDACHSGEAVNSFKSRGFAEEKAITQLARSTGATLIASTTSTQFASEFSSLGHGIFTYALLEGLNGNADTVSKDGKVTVKELESYLNDILPLLTEKYRGKHQYPTSWSYGQDFPIKVIN